MNDIEFFADVIRNAPGDYAGVREVAAIALLRSAAENTHGTDAERVQRLRDVLAALDMVNAEKSA